MSRLAHRLLLLPGRGGGRLRLTGGLRIQIAWPVASSPLKLENRRWYDASKRCSLRSLLFDCALK